MKCLKHIKRIFRSCTKFSDGFSNKVPNTLGDILPQYGEDDSIATRAASQKAINA